VSKDAPIFETLGTMDELNTVLGWCRSVCAIDWLVGEKMISAILLDVQNHLFTIQAELAGAKKSIPAKEVSQMENIIVIIDEQLPEIKSFFVPGSRRAERRIVVLNNSDKKISEYTMKYTNRLSSLLYALVRFVNYQTDTDEQSPKYVD